MTINIRLLKTLCVSAMLCVTSFVEDVHWLSAASAQAEPAREAALDRLLAKVPEEVQPFFDVLILVDKSSQNMSVFERGADGNFSLFGRWKVSTGGARHDTPVGFYTFDPVRMYRMWHSRAYNNAPMPWAMFFDARIAGRATGLAVHGTEALSRLGTRASHGCVRLDPAHARELQERVRRVRGTVPVFAYDDRGGRTSAEGVPLHNAAGGIVTKAGYRALLLIDDGEPLVTS